MKNKPTAKEILELIRSKKDYTAVYGKREDFYSYDDDFEHLRDYDNFYFGMRKIVEYSQDKSIVFPLIGFMDEFQEMIEKRKYASFWATDENAFAMQILDDYKTNKGCSCELYATDYLNHLGRLSKWIMFEPENEEEKGYIIIHQKPHRISENEVRYNYLVSCTKCGQRFIVGDREYHYRWWNWEKVDNE